MANKNRLIDANAAKELWKGDNQTAITMRRIFDGLPTVDAVEVVRCKDCKWYRVASIDNVPYCCHESGYCGEYMSGLFFCACGERRIDGDS